MADGWDVASESANAPWSVADEAPLSTEASDPWAPVAETPIHPNRNLISELGISAIRGARGMKAELLDAPANLIENKLAGITGNEWLKRDAAANAQAIKQYKDETAAKYGASVPSYTDVKDLPSAAQYVAGKVGELPATVAGYLGPQGIPRMVAANVLGGAASADEETNGNPLSVAAGAAISGTTAGLVGPFVKGAAGKSLKEQVVRNAAGMGTINAVTPITGNVPKAINTSNPWDVVPTAETEIESILGGAISGAALGAGHRIIHGNVEPAPDSTAHFANAPHYDDLVNGAQRYNLSPSLVLTASGIESDFGRAANTNTGSNYGILQLNRENYEKVGIDPDKARTDRALQIEGGLKYLALTRNELAAKLDRTPTDFEIYMAHQQGVAGATAMIRALATNPDAPAASAIAPFYKSHPGLAEKAIAGNTPHNKGEAIDPNPSIADWWGKWQGLWARKSGGAEIGGFDRSAANTDRTPDQQPQRNQEPPPNLTPHDLAFQALLEERGLSAMTDEHGVTHYVDEHGDRHQVEEPKEATGQAEQQQSSKAQPVEEAIAPAPSRAAEATAPAPPPSPAVVDEVAKRQRTIETLQAQIANISRTLVREPDPAERDRLGALAQQKGQLIQAHREAVEALMPAAKPVEAPAPTPAPQTVRPAVADVPLPVPLPVPFHPATEHPATPPAPGSAPPQEGGVGDRLPAAGSARAENPAPANTQDIAHSAPPSESSAVAHAEQAAPAAGTILNVWGEPGKRFGSILGENDTTIVKPIPDHANPGDIYQNIDWQGSGAEPVVEPARPEPTPAPLPPAAIPPESIIGKSSEPAGAMPHANVDEKEAPSVRKPIQEMTTAELRAEHDGYDNESALRSDNFDEQFDRHQAVRNEYANRLGAEPGGLVLESKTHDGRSLGAFISPEPDGTGRWRITWFDKRGFSGDTQRATKAEAVRDAIKEGYSDTNRNLLREFMKEPSFHEGNAETERVRKWNEEQDAKRIAAQEAAKPHPGAHTGPQRLLTRALDKLKIPASRRQFSGPAKARTLVVKDQTAAEHDAIQNEIGRQIEIGVRASARAKGRIINNPDLLQFLAMNGGVRDVRNIDGVESDAGDLRAMDAHKWFHPALKTFIRKHGMSLDDARELAEEAGYIKEGSDVNTLLEAIRANLSGKPVRTIAGHMKAIEDKESPYAPEPEDEPKDDAEAALMAYDDDNNLRFSEEEHLRARDLIEQGASVEDAHMQVLSERLQHIAHTDYYAEPWDDIPFDMPGTLEAFHGSDPFGDEDDRVGASGRPEPEPVGENEGRDGAHPESHGDHAPPASTGEEGRSESVSGDSQGTLFERQQSPEHPTGTPERIGAATVYRDPATADARHEAQGKLRALVNRIVGGNKAEVHVVDHIETEDGGAATGFIHDGNRIYIAKGDLERMAGTANHEIIHFMRGTGLLEGNRWKVLEGAAKGWREEFGINDTYAPDIERWRANGLSKAEIETRLNEEAIATAAARFANGTLDPIPRGFMANVMRAVHEFIEGVRNAVAGKGFNTAAGTLRDIQAGRLAERPAEGRIGERATAFQREDKGPTPHGLARMRLLAKERENPVEHIFTIDADNNVKYAGSGDIGSVGFDEGWANRLNDPNEAIHIHHNHPSGKNVSSALSDSDISFLGHDGVVSITAHMSNGDWSSAVLRNSFNNDLFGKSLAPAKAMKAFATMAYDGAFDQFSNVPANVLPRDVAVAVYQHAANMALDKAGIIHYDTNFQFPMTMAQKKVFDNIVSNIAIHVANIVTQSEAFGRDYSKDIEHANDLTDTKLPGVAGGVERFLRARNEHAAKRGLWWSESSDGSSLEENPGSREEAGVDGDARRSLSSEGALNASNFARTGTPGVAGTVGRFLQTRGATESGRGHAGREGDRPLSQEGGSSGVEEGDGRETGTGRAGDLEEQAKPHNPGTMVEDDEGLNANYLTQTKSPGVAGGVERFLRARGEANRSGRPGGDQPARGEEASQGAASRERTGVPGGDTSSDSWNRLNSEDHGSDLTHTERAVGDPGGVAGFLRSRDETLPRGGLRERASHSDAMETGPGDRGEGGVHGAGEEVQGGTGSYGKEGGLTNDSNGRDDGRRRTHGYNVASSTSDAEQGGGGKETAASANGEHEARTRYGERAEERLRSRTTDLFTKAVFGAAARLPDPIVGAEAKKLRLSMEVGPLDHKRDLGWFESAWNVPRHIAAKFPAFAHVFSHQLSRRNLRETMVKGTLIPAAADYVHASNKVKKIANAIIEIADRNNIDLTNLPSITNNIGGPRDANGLVNSNRGDTFRITPEVRKALNSYKATMDAGLDLLKTTIYDRFGMDPATSPRTFQDAINRAAACLDPNKPLPPDLHTVKVAKNPNAPLNHPDEWRVVDSSGKVVAEGITEQEAINAWKQDNARLLFQLAYHLKKFDDWRTAHPSYMPHSRYGDYGIAVKGPDGKTVHFETYETNGNAYGRFRTQGDARSRVEELKQLFPAHLGYDVTQPFQMFGDTPTPLQQTKLSDLDRLASYIDVDGSVKDYLTNQYMKRIQKDGFGRHFLTRENIPGYSGDVERVLHSYIMGVSGFVAKQRFGRKIEQATAGIPQQGNAKLAEYAKDYNNYIDSGNAEAAGFRMMTYMWALGGNVSSAVRDLFQLPNITAPYLSMFAGHSTIAKEMTKAAADVTAMVRLGKFDLNAAPADVRNALKTSDLTGVLAAQQQATETMVQSGSMPECVRRLAPPVRTAIKYVSGLYTAAQRFNRLVTHITVQRMAKNPEFLKNVARVLGNDGGFRAMFPDARFNPAGIDPRKLAEFITDETHFNMSKGNRPVMQRGVVGATVTQFKGFHFNNLQLLGRMAAQYGPEGKRAFAYSLLGYYIASAGFLGLPFAQNIEDWYEASSKKFFDTTVDLKLEYAKLMDQLSVNHGISEFLEHGFTRSLGVDLGARVGLGEILPRNVEDVLGPGVSIFGTALFNAAKELSQGRPEAAASAVLPPPFKGIANAYKLSQEGRRTSKGHVDIAAPFVTNQEIAATALGFQPASFARQHEYEGAERVVIANPRELGDMVRQNIKSIYIQAVGQPNMVLTQKQVDEVNAQVKNITNWNDKHPEQHIAMPNFAALRKEAREGYGPKVSKKLRTEDQKLRDYFLIPNR